VSPEAKGSAATLARLLAEIAEDRVALAAREADAQEAQRRLALASKDAGALALAAVSLHGWYTGLETIFERIAREFDESVPTGDRWHRELLFQMTADIPGVRRPVIEPDLVGDLAALLAFRHFFRHAYAVKFDDAHLGAELARLMRSAPMVRVALDRFVAFLNETLAQVTAL
jgi:HepT-like protein